MSHARHFARLAAALLALLCAGCSSGYGRAVATYEHARYPEALEELRRAEADVDPESPRERARYALYRGLTHLALGDRGGTLRWLSEAKRALDECPTLLSADEAGRLAAAWSHLPDGPELGASD